MNRLRHEFCGSFHSAVEHLLECRKEQSASPEVDEQRLPVRLSARGDDQEEESDNADARDSNSGEPSV